MDKEDEGRETTTALTNGKQTQTQIIMQTAQLDVTNRQTGVQKRCNVIFDGGSQHTYITKKLASDLKLRELGSENLSIGVFGKNKRKVESKGVVKFELGKNKLKKEIHAFVQDTICLPLGQQMISPGSIEKCDFSMF